MQGQLVEMTADFGVRVRSCGYVAHLATDMSSDERSKLSIAAEDALSEVEQMGGRVQPGDDSRIARSRSDLIHWN